MMIWIPLVLTSMVVALALRRRPSVDRNLGYMSQQWLIECHASQRAGSV